MLTMRYWLYDLALSDVKENTVRMIVFHLLIQPFHTPIQIPNEWQLHTIIPFHQIPSSFPHEQERKDPTTPYLHANSHSLRHLPRYTEQAIIHSFTRALQRKRAPLSFADNTCPLPARTIPSYRNPATANRHPESTRMYAHHRRSTLQFQMQYT